MKRHSGVLGLAALVEACPYSIPEWLPEVLDEMALHLHDRAPIQVSEWNRYSLCCHNNEESYEAMCTHMDFLPIYMCE